MHLKEQSISLAGRAQESFGSRHVNIQTCTRARQPTSRAKKARFVIGKRPDIIIIKRTGKCASTDSAPCVAELASGAAEMRAFNKSMSSCCRDIPNLNLYPSRTNARLYVDAGLPVPLTTAKVLYRFNLEL
jgi:hypothetical protein